MWSQQCRQVIRIIFDSLSLDGDFLLQEGNVSTYLGSLACCETILDTLSLSRASQF